MHKRARQPSYSTDNRFGVSEDLPQGRCVRAFSQLEEGVPAASRHVKVWLAVAGCELALNRFWPEKAQSIAWSHEHVTGTFKLGAFPEVCVKISQTVQQVQHLRGMPPER